MAGVESKSESQRQDGQIASQNSIRLAENLEGFQQCVKEILDLTQKEEDFSKVTSEIYDSKKSKLTELVTELSGMHAVLVNQNVDLIREVSKTPPPMKTHHVDPSTSTSLQVTQTSKTKLECSFNSSGGGFSFSPVKNEASKVKETKGRDHDVLLNKISTLEKERVKMKKKIQDLTDENALLEAQKENVAEYKRRIETMENMLEAYRKQVKTAENEKQELSEKMEYQTRQFLSMDQNIASTIERLASQQDDEIRELNAQITLQKIFHSERNADIEMLKTEIREKCELIDDLNQKHEAQILKTEQLKRKVVEFKREVDAMEVMLEEGTEAIRPKLDSKEAGVFSLYEEVNKFKAEISKQDAQITKLNAEIARLEKEIREKTELVGDLNQKNDALMSNTEELKVKVVELDKAEEKMEAIRLELDSKEARIRKLCEEVNGFKADISKRDDAIEKLNVKIVDLTGSHAGEEDRLNTDIKMLKTEIGEKTRLVDDWKQKHDVLTSYTNEMKAKVAELGRLVMKFEYNVSVQSSDSTVLTLTV